MQCFVNFAFFEIMNEKMREKIAWGRIPFDPAGGLWTPFSIGSFTSSMIGCGITGGLVGVVTAGA